MADNAERGVIFTLKAQIDAQAKSAVDSFFATITDASNSVSSATEKVVKTAEKSAEEIVKSWTSAFDAVNTSASQVKQDDSAIQTFLSKSGDAYDAFVKAQADRLQKLTDAESQNRDVSAMSLAELLDEQNSRTESAYEREKRTVEEALAKELQAMNAYFAAVEELRNKAANQAEELTNEEIEDVQRLEKEAVEATSNRQKADERFLKTTGDERKRQVAEQIGEIRRVEAEQERTAAEARRRNEQIGASVGRVVSAFSEGSEALMRFANGFKYLGLVGEKDLQKLTDALLTIQGTTQVFTGAIRLVRQASEGYDAYRRVVLLTAEAHNALTTAQTASAASAAANGAVQAGSAAGADAGGSTMGRLATGAARMGTGIGMAAGQIGIEAGGAAGLTIFGAAIAAVSGALFAAVSAVDTFRNALKFGAGGGAVEGSLTQSIGTSSMNPFARAMGTGSALEAGQTVARGILDPFNLFGFKGKTTGEKQADDEKKNIDRLAQIQATRAEQQRRDEEDLNKIVSERSAIEMQRAATERETMQHRLGAMAAEERRAKIISEIATVEKDSTLTAEQRAKQMIQWSTQRLSVEREISAERMRSAQETLAAAQQELQTKEQQLKSAQDAAMSAQERFGLLSAEEQQQLLASQKQFAAGAQGVGVEDLRKLRGFSGAMDEQIASEARRRAQAAGFGAFQTEDVKRIQQLETERQQIEVKVKAQAQVVATLEVDAKKVADQINKQIDAQYGIILKAMAEQIGMTSAKVKELEDGMRNRFTRI
jgi:hypothetical protein